MPARSAALVLALLAAPAAARPPAEVAAALDREIDARLAAANVPPSPPASDAEFLRRAALDLTGRLPSPEKAAAFLDSTAPDKRARLIDELLADPAFGQRFAAYWTELFVKRNDTAGRLNAVPFKTWLAGEFNRGAGWDRVVTDMLTAGPDSGASLFLLTNRENDIAPNRVAGTVGVLFLGLQLQCAECHRHPTTREWKREDFWGLAAFFARTTIKAETKDKGRDRNGLPAIRDLDESPREFVPRPNPKMPPPPPGPFLPPGVIEIPDATDPTKRVGRAPARFLGGEPVTLPETGSHRAPLAAWVTARDNPYFARAYANRMWAYFLARGFVNPVDDLGPDAAPSHAEALDALAAEFAASGFDPKHLARVVCNTKAYQRSSLTLPGNANDTALFSRAPVKAVRGPVLLDLMDQVLGRPRNGLDPKVPEKTGTRPTPTADLVDTAGYDESPDEYTSGVPQALRLMNALLPGRTAAAGTLIAEAGATPKSNAAKEAERFAPPGSVVPLKALSRAAAVERIFLATLTRRPTPTEAADVAAFLDRQTTPAAGYDALLWVLLSSPEFVTNH